MSFRHSAVLVRHSISHLFARRTRRSTSVVTLSLVFVAVSLVSIPFDPDRAAAVEVTPPCTTVDLTSLGRLLSPKVGTEADREARIKAEETNTVDVEELNGDYEIILISRDDLHGDSGQPVQDNEQWFLEGLNENGDVVVTSQPTGDLNSLKKSEPFNVGTEPFENVVKLRARHAQLGDGIDSIQPGSVILRNETCTSDEEDDTKRYELVIGGTTRCVGINSQDEVVVEQCATSDSPNLEFSTTYFEETPIDNGKFLLRSVLTGKCVAAPLVKGVVAPGKAIPSEAALVECDANNNNQQFERVGDRLVSVFNQCISVDTERTPTDGDTFSNQPCEAPEVGEVFTPWQNLYPTTGNEYPKTELRIKTESGDNRPTLETIDLENSKVSATVNLANRGPQDSQTTIVELFLPYTVTLRSDVLEGAGLDCETGLQERVNSGPLNEFSRRSDWGGSGNQPAGQPQEQKHTCQLIEPLRHNETVLLPVEFTIPNSSQTSFRFHVQTYSTSQELDYSNNRITVNPLPIGAIVTNQVLLLGGVTPWLNDALGLDLGEGTVLCSTASADPILPRNITPGFIENLVQSIEGQGGFRPRNPLQFPERALDVLKTVVLESTDCGDAIDVDDYKAAIELLIEIVESRDLADKERAIGDFYDEAVDPSLWYLTRSETAAINELQGSPGNPLDLGKSPVFEGTKLIEAFPIPANAQNISVINKVANYNPERALRIWELNAAGLPIVNAIRTAEFETNSEARDNYFFSRYPATDEAVTNFSQENPDGAEINTPLRLEAYLLQTQQLEQYVQNNDIDSYPSWLTDDDNESLETWTAFLLAYPELVAESYAFKEQSKLESIIPIALTRETGEGLAGVTLHAWADLSDGKIDRPTTPQLIQLSAAGGVPSDFKELGSIVADLLEDDELLYAIYSGARNNDYLDNELLDQQDFNEVRKESGSFADHIDNADNAQTTELYEFFFSEEPPFRLNSASLSVFSLRLASYGSLRFALCEKAPDPKACSESELDVRTNDLEAVKTSGDIPILLDNAIDQVLALRLVDEPDRTKYEIAQDIVGKVALVVALTTIVLALPGIGAGSVTILGASLVKVLGAVAFGLEIAEVALAVVNGDEPTVLFGLIGLSAFGGGEIDDIVSIFRKTGINRKDQEIIDNVVNPFEQTRTDFKQIDETGTFPKTPAATTETATKADALNYLSETASDPAVTIQIVNEYQTAIRRTASNPKAIDAIETNARIANNHPNAHTKLFETADGPTAAALQQTIAEQPNFYDNLLSKLTDTELDELDPQKLVQALKKQTPLTETPLTETPLRDANEWADDFAQTTGISQETSRRTVEQWYENKLGLRPGSLKRLLDEATPSQLDEIEQAARKSAEDGRTATDAVTCSRFSSFPSGTQVRMGDGSLKAIETIEVGDTVLAADPVTGEWSNQTVLNQWSYIDHGEMVTATLEDGSTTTATDHHKYWIDNRGAWVDLEDIQQGDHLLTPNGITTVEKVIEHQTSETLVWELDTTGPDTFTVWTGSSDVLVHNADCEIDADGNVKITNDDGSTVTLRSNGTADYIEPNGTSYQNVRIDGEGNVQFSDKQNQNPIYEHSGGAERSPVLTKRADGQGFDSDGGLLYRSADPTYTDRVDHVLQHKYGNNKPNKTNPSHTTFPDGVDPIKAVDEAWNNRPSVIPQSAYDPVRDRWAIDSQSLDGTRIRIIVQGNPGEPSNIIVTAFPL